MSNEITKAVRSDDAELRMGKTLIQPVAMSDNRGLWQQVFKEAGLLEVRYEPPVSLITARQQRRQATVQKCLSGNIIINYLSGNMIMHAFHQLNQTAG